ncbi:hypothetical protein GGS20DRAFT_584285 [Poronia punctata]|nr:hypothetical protein GGS20DRAFT_584285 [Poronia punctata]
MDTRIDDEGAIHIHRSSVNPRVEKLVCTNHPNVFHHVGFETEFLPWYHSETHSLAIDAPLSRIDYLPNRPLIVMQVSGTARQDVRLATTSRNLRFPQRFSIPRRRIPRFRQRIRPGLSTYAKAFGLYGERAGILLVMLDNKEEAKRPEGRMKLLARAETGAQPLFGATIVQTIIADEQPRQV